MMLDSFIPPVVQRATRAVRAVAVPALLSALALSAIAAGTPSQTPLITRASPQVKPNVMVTVDDSGSMTWGYMPEGVITVNTTFQVPMPPSMVINDVPDEPVLYYTQRGNAVYTAPAIPPKKQTGTTTFITQRWLRSPQVNSIYYNPMSTYLPWQKADGSRFPVASYNAAVYDPLNLLSGQTDLGATITRPSKTASVNWLVSLYNDNGVSKSNGADSTTKYAFDPALIYILKDTTVDPNLVTSYTEYDLNATTAPTMPKNNGSRTDCKSDPCTIAEEQQNFANWFVYYRTRTLMAKAALSETLPSSIGQIRLGWGSINAPGVIRQDMTDLTAASMATLLGDIQSFVPHDSTPLRTALKTVGDYFMLKKGDSRNPWYDTLTDTSSSLSACRRSYNILMTDGYYNDSYSGVGNVDGNKGPDQSADNPNKYPVTQYVPSRPFSDTQSDMLADVAMYYYVNDLQPDIPNKLKYEPVANPDDATRATHPDPWPYPQGPTWQDDIAYWQHLQEFTVGLGVTGNLNVDVDLPSLVSGAKWWSANHIDDLWHAALDTHGRFFSAKNSGQLATSLSAALGSAGGDASHEAGAVASSTSLVAGTLKYVPSYVPVAWSGDLTAYNINVTTGQQGSVAWAASGKGKVPDYTLRNSWVWDMDSNAPVQFRWANMQAKDQALVNGKKATIGTQKYFGTDGSDALINYINGDVSNEGSEKLYRDRNGAVLPDFVDSPPLFVKNFVDTGLGTFQCSGVSYNSYVAAKNARTAGTIFVGGNGGMLHAFDSATGVEQFDFVPRSGLPNLATIASKSYGTVANPHQFFVDGPLLESDACIKNRRTSASWTNLVVGALGAGGTGLFVLDTTTVGTSKPQFDGSMVLHEWSGLDDNDIGYIFANPQIGMINGGAWKIFAGNGVDSSNGKAYLLVLDLSNFNVDKIQLGSASGSSGAMGVRLVYNASKQAIGAYVGDVQGNMWRVEFQGSTASTWKVGYNGAPLFQAKDTAGKAQPITAVPAITQGASGGNVVLFGTGKLFDTGDADTTDVQSAYGVVDPKPMTTDTTTGVGPFYGVTNPRTKLGVQMISSEDLVTQADGKTTTVFYNVTPPTTASASGWVMDLVFAGAHPIAAGTRVIYPPQMFGNSVFINALTPAGAPAECATNGGMGYFFLLNAATGSQAVIPSWDTNGDGVFSNADLNDAGVGTSAGGTATIVLVPGSPDAYFMNSDTSRRGRSLSVNDRVWRQILTPPSP